MANRVPDYDPSILPTTQIGARGRQAFAQGAGVASVNRQDFGTVVSDGGKGYAELGARVDQLVNFELQREAENARFQGAEEGEAAGALPGWKPKTENTIRAHAYNEAGKKSALLRLDHDTRIALDGFEKQYEADPVGFERAANSYRDGVVQTLPGNMGTRYSQAFDLLALPGLNRSRDKAEKAQVDQATANWETQWPSMVSSVQRNARSAATDPAAGLAARLDLMRAQDTIVAFGPKQAFTLNGVEYPADPTRMGAFTVTKMTEKMVKLRDEADENQALGFFYAGPQSVEWVDAWRKREMSAEGSGLREEQVARLQNTMFAEVNKKTQGQAAQRGALTEEIKDHFAQLERTGTGKTGVTVDRVRQLWGDEKAAEFVRDETTARETYAAGETLRYATPQQAALTLESFKPAPNSENYAEKIAKYDKLVARYTKLREDFKNDPAGYVLTMPGVSSRETSFEAQRQLGAVPGSEWILPKKEAELRVQALVNAKPEARANMMQDWSKAAGNDWRYVYHDLVRAKLPDEYRVLATISDSLARKKYSEVLNLKPEEFTKQLDGKEVADARRIIINEMADWKKTLNYSPDGVKVGGIYQHAAEMLAFSYMVGGKNSTEAAKRAVNEIVNNDYEFVDEWRAPKGKGADIAVYAARVQLALKPEELVVPPRTQKDAFASDQARSAEYWKGVQSGKWVTSPDDSGLVLLDQDGQPVRRRRVDPATGDVTEQAVTFSFADANNSPIRPVTLGGYQVDVDTKARAPAAGGASVTVAVPKAEGASVTVPIAKPAETASATVKIPPVPGNASVTVPIPAAPGVPKDLVEHVADWEKFQPKKFYDVKGYNIGYGTAARGREMISEPEARREMVQSLESYAATIDQINPNLPQGVRKALISLAFNTAGSWLDKGDRNADGSLNLRGLIAAGDLAEARERFKQYVQTQTGGVLRGLERRRADELEKFWPKNASIAKK